MDLLKTILLYMTMVYASSVQNMPDAEQVLAALTTPEPTQTVAAEVASASATPEPITTSKPTPVPTVAISPNPDYKTIYMGDKGDRVRELQEKLAAYGYYIGKIDGRYGNQTRDAVQKFQYNHGLTADGIAGKNTLTVLYDSNQVRPADPVATTTPDSGSIRVAITPSGSTPEPIVAATTAPTFAPTFTPEPEPTETPAVMALNDIGTPTESPAAAPELDFLPMDGWVIQIAGQSAPLALTDENGGQGAAIVPYTYGLDVYVPLMNILQSTGAIVIPSESVSLTEYAFALGNDLYRITYTEAQDGKPTDLNIYKNNQPQIAPIRDVRMGGGFVYLPAQTVSGLTGMTFALDEAGKVLTINLPAGIE